MAIPPHYSRELLSGEQASGARLETIGLWILLKWKH